MLSWVWALPFGEDHALADGGILKPILENWQFSGIVTLSTGRPFTVFLNTGVNNGAPSWPNRIGDGKLDEPTPDLWFDIDDFVAPPPNTYGDSGRGILYAPGTQTVDVSLSRIFPIGSRFRLQFRADAFNLFNTPQFGFPNAEHRLADRRPHHLYDRRQPLDAVRAEAGLVTPPGESEGGGMPPSGP